MTTPRSRRAVCLGLALLTAALAAPGCGLGPRVLLAVDLQTDVAPGLEFQGVRVTANDASEMRAVTADERFLEGARVAELRVPPGTVRVSVELIDTRSRRLAERTVLVDLRRDTVIVVPIPGTCRGVVCEPEQTCIRGNCVDPTTICGGDPCDADAHCMDGVCDPECDLDAECEPVDPCSTPRCYRSVCVGVPAPGACPESLYCSVGVGCRSYPSGWDGGTGLPDGAIPPGDGGVGGDAGTCGPCTAPCGTMGELACDASGEPTTICIPPMDTCNGADDDCDGMIDEGLTCDHTHPVVFTAGTAGMTVLADRVQTAGPGNVCAGTACGSTLSGWQTLPGPDGHVHPIGGTITFGTSSMSFSPPGVGTASGHTHSIGCTLPGAWGTYHYELDDPGDATRYDMFCMGDTTGPCGDTFGACTAQ